jgi:Tfp pilus assembly ATPase PilU
MDRTISAVLAAILTACLCLFIPTITRAETEVDLALVLAVDVSRSMDPEEQELQRQGFIEAFRSPLVHDAIRNGMLGRIMVTYVEWCSVDEQTVISPWDPH